MRRFIIVTCCLVIAACSSGSGRMPPDGQMPTGEQGGSAKVGKPYKIGGQWYRPEHDPYYDETGIASWYGKQFHGKLTANQEIFNMNALTAAHRTLAMPTYVKVTNLENGRSVVLRVNDRGPFAKGRIIDVSRRGAQILGFERQGTTRVRVQASDERGKVIAKSKRKSRPSDVRIAKSSDGHFVQVGAYASLDNARKRRAALENGGQKARVVTEKTGGQTLYKVRVGPFNSRSLAEKVLDRIISLGFYDARVTSITR